MTVFTHQSRGTVIDVSQFYKTLY